MLYYKRHIGDYIKDTAHLSLVEHGAYARLMDVYYGRESPLPEADVFRLVGARAKEEVAAVKAVLREFWTLESNGWVQARCDHEIGKAREKAGTNRENGKKGGRPRGFQSQPEPKENPLGSQIGTQVKPTQNPNVTLSNNPTIQSSNQNPPTPLAGGLNGVQAPPGRKPRQTRDRSRDAWQSVTAAVDRVKGTELTWSAVTEQLADPHADTAIESIGGHKAIADRSRFNAGELESRFRHAYEGLIDGTDSELSA